MATYLAVVNIDRAISNAELISSKLKDVIMSLGVNGLGNINIKTPKDPTTVVNITMDVVDPRIMDNTTTISSKLKDVIMSSLKVNIKSIEYITERS